MASTETRRRNLKIMECGPKVRQKKIAEQFIMCSCMLIKEVGSRVCTEQERG